MITFKHTKVALFNFLYLQVDYNKPISLITLETHAYEYEPELSKVEYSARFASVRSFGEISYGAYLKAGLEKRCDFESNTNYTLIIRANGNGFYFDRSKLKQGQSTFKRMALSC